MGVGKGSGTISNNLSFTGTFETSNVTELISLWALMLLMEDGTLLVTPSLVILILITSSMITKQVILSLELTMLCMPMMVMIVMGLFGQFTMETTLLVNTSLLVKHSL